ncbi:MAG: peptidase S45 [Gammaproteobacteria bacterium]|nr:peptidase S45 [Gammaproteobacteria bacterium]
MLNLALLFVHLTMLKDTLMCRFKLLFFFFFPFYSSFSQVDISNIEIVRDKWGIPHIYGKTDKEAAYGLAWAHAEDDFKTIQKTFLPAKGMLGSLEGIRGAVLDYAVELLKSREVAYRELKNLPPEGLNVIYGYLDGLNAYASKYPEQVLVKGSFPLSIYDYLTGLNLMLHLFSDTGDIIGQLLSNSINPIDEMSGVDNIGSSIGSNGFAFNSFKTLDKKSYLNINTHQPLEGPFAWYEAHINSDEGWNMLGGLFPGLPLPVIGTNENLGWTHPYNYPDMNDVFQLVINPKNKNQYKLDGIWENFEIKNIKLKVKSILGLKIKVRRKIIWSKFGPVIKNKKGYFAFFSQSLNNISAIEQWLKMNKAANFNEFEEALKLLGIPRFNIVYADREDNIFYMSNARLSVRDNSINWRNLVIGDTSSLILNKYHPYDDLPKLLNPPSGYIFNTNNSPFNSTSKEYNLIEEDYNSTFSYREKENNRSLRFMEIIKDYDKVNFDDFKKIKYDQKYPDSLAYVGNINKIFTLNVQDENLSDVHNLIKNWDKGGSYDNLGAAQWSLFYRFILDILSENNLKVTDEISITFFEDALSKTKKHLQKYFNRIDIVLGDLQKHVRGDVVLPVSGLIDMIAPTYVIENDNGTFRSVSGESYIMLVQYSDSGVEIETVLPYGNSNNNKSPHYTDQMKLYIDKKTKKMTLDKDKIYNEAESIYNPN